MILKPQSRTGNVTSSDVHVMTVVFARAGPAVSANTENAAASKSTERFIGSLPSRSVLAGAVAILLQNARGRRPAAGRPVSCSSMAVSVGELVAANVADQRVWDAYGESSAPGVYLLGNPGRALPFTLFRAWKVP